MVSSIFEVDVAQGIERLAMVLENPQNHEVEGELRAQAEVFAGFAEILGLPGFGEISLAINDAIDAHPDRILEIMSLALDNFQVARELVLAGDRQSGGSPSEALKALGAVIPQEQNQTTALEGLSDNTSTNLSSTNSDANLPPSTSLPIKNQLLNSDHLFDSLEMDSYGEQHSSIQTALEEMMQLEEAVALLAHFKQQKESTSNNNNALEPVINTYQNLATTNVSVPTVLVVDDSAMMRKTLTLTLQKVGYRVLQARDGKEALELLLQNSTVDLIVSDLEMPRLNGFEFLNELRKKPLSSAIPVVMLTTRINDKHRQLALHLGASAYMSKPYIEQEFLDVLRNTVNRETNISALPYAA
jgi:CheY-like chemotaxis protein